MGDDSERIPLVGSTSGGVNDGYQSGGTRGQVVYFVDRPGEEDESEEEERREHGESSEEMGDVEEELELARRAREEEIERLRWKLSINSDAIGSNAYVDERGPESGSWHDRDYFVGVGVETGNDAVNESKADLNVDTVATPPKFVLLERRMTLLDAIAIVVGDIIGTGIFSSPGVVLAASNNSVALSLVVWLGAGILSMLGGICYGELAASMPSAGGDYAYFVRAFGKLIGFIYVWLRFFVLNSGSTALLGIVFAQYLGSLVFDNPDLIDGGSSTSSSSSSSGSSSGEENRQQLGIKLMAAGAILVLTLVNCYGVRWGTGVQRVLFCVKLLSMVFVVGMAIYSTAVTGMTTQILKQNFESPFQGTVSWSFKTFISAFGVGTISALWAYDGWIDVTMVAEEVRSPGRNLPRAIIAGSSFVIVAFLIVNVAYLCVLPASEIASSQTVGILLATRVFGGEETSQRSIGAILMSVAVALSALGTMNGTILSGGRVFFAAARDNNFPIGSQYLSVVGSQGTPWVALVVQGIVSIILVFPGSFGTLVDYFGFTAWSIYALAGCSLILLRLREPELLRPFLVRPYPYLPVVFILVSFAVCIAVFAEQPIPSAASLGFVLLSIPFHFLFLSEETFWVNLRARAKRRWQRSKRKAKSLCETLFPCCRCCCHPHPQYQHPQSNNSSRSWSFSSSSSSLPSNVPISINQ